jgi:hypothetical protein
MELGLRFHQLMPLKIFISHAAVDEPLAKALVACLLSSMVLDDEDIRCTSVAGHMLPIGSDFTQTILRDLEDAAVVVGLITRNSVSSGWVLFELGATWGARKTLWPLVTDEIDPKTLPGALAARHVARLSKNTDVAQFLDEIIKRVSAKPRSHAKMAQSVSDLLAAHAAHIAAASSRKETPRDHPEIKEPPFAAVPVQTFHAGAREEAEDRLRQMHGHFRKRDFYREVHGLSKGTGETEQLSTWSLKRLIREGWGNDKARECRVHDLDMLFLTAADRKDKQKVTAAERRLLEVLQSLGIATGLA